jgi:hypothetical protein
MRTNVNEVIGFHALSLSIEYKLHTPSLNNNDLNHIVIPVPEHQVLGNGIAKDYVSILILYLDVFVIYIRVQIVESFLHNVGRFVQKYGMIGN